MLFTANHVLSSQLILLANTHTITNKTRPILAAGQPSGVCPVVSVCGYLSLCHRVSARVSARACGFCCQQILHRDNLEAEAGCSALIPNAKLRQGSAAAWPELQRDL